MNIPKDIMFTNLDIARAFAFSLDQVRRWALIAFQTEAATEWGKGKKRKYDIDETFKIYMSVLLSIEGRLSLQQAIDHLNNLWPHLKEHNALPLQIISGELSEHIIAINKFTLIEQIYIHPGSVYDFRSVEDCEKISEEDARQTYYLKYRIIRFTPLYEFPNLPSLTRNNTISPTLVIHFDEYLENYLSSICDYVSKKQIKRFSADHPFDLRRRNSRIQKGGQ